MTTEEKALALVNDCGGDVLVVVRNGNAWVEALRHDLERYMTIANEHVNEAERLREALEAAPIISLWESKEDFRRRQDGWLKTKYRAALEQSK